MTHIYSGWRSLVPLSGVPYSSKRSLPILESFAYGFQIQSGRVPQGMLYLIFQKGSHSS